jgi:hypothetical protein
MDEQLELLYFDSRWSFGALLNFEGDAITFRKALKTLAFDGAMVNKDIFAAILYRDKSVTLLIVEPLYSTLRHNSSNPFILLVWTLLNTRNINVKSRWKQEIKQERPVSAVLPFPREKWRHLYYRFTQRSIAPS